MASSSFTKMFSIFSITLLFSISNVYSAPPYALVNKVCSKVPNTNFCLAILKSDSRSQFADKISILTQIAVDVAKKKATNTQNYFRGVKDGPPGVLKSLKDCIDAYTGVISSLNVCMSEEECDLTSYDIHSAGDEIKRCQSIADKNGAHGSLITSSNKANQDICSLSEALADRMC